LQPIDISCLGFSLRISHSKTKGEDMRYPVLQTSAYYPYINRWRRALSLALLVFLMPGVSSVSLAQTGSCADLVADSSLESGSGWAIKTNGGYTLLSTVQAHTGAGSAYLAGVDNANDLLSTILALPGDKSLIVLSFWWKVNSEDRSDVNDKFAVQVVDSAGKAHKSLFTLGSARASNRWQQSRIDLHEFAGQQIQLQFMAKTDDALVTDFFVDDVEVNACAAR
jgi:hypothetical protein